MQSIGLLMASSNKTDRDSPTPDKGQGITRDDKGQEQPADKERARDLNTPHKDAHRKAD